MCKKKSSYHAEMSVKFASNPATGMQGHTMTKNMHFTSFTAVEVTLRGLSNLKITGHALLPYRTRRIVQKGRYIDGSTNLQFKITCNIREEIIKLA